MGKAVRVSGGGDITDRLEAAGYRVRPIDAENTAPLVAVGEAGLVAAANATDPVLPVAVPGVPSIPPPEIVTALDAVRPSRSDGEESPTETLRLPRLCVQYAAERVGRSVIEVALLPDEAGQISSFRIASADPLGTVRADGVVVATPAGSGGYAGAAGGPRLAPTTDALAIVPIAAFTPDPDRWVVPVEPIAITVVGDSPARLATDGNAVGTVDSGSTLRVVPDGAIDILVGPWSESWTAAPAASPGGAAGADAESAGADAAPEQ